VHGLSGHRKKNFLIEVERRDPGTQVIPQARTRGYTLLYPGWGGVWGLINWVEQRPRKKKNVHKGLVRNREYPKTGLLEPGSGVGVQENGIPCNRVGWIVKSQKNKQSGKVEVTKGRVRPN